jgi:hypothetical protein
MMDVPNVRLNSTDTIANKVPKSEKQAMNQHTVAREALKHIDSPGNGQSGPLKSRTSLGAPPLFLLVPHIAPRQFSTVSTPQTESPSNPAKRHRCALLDEGPSRQEPIRRRSSFGSHHTEQQSRDSDINHMAPWRYLMKVMRKRRSKDITPERMRWKY